MIGRDRQREGGVAFRLPGRRSRSVGLVAGFFGLATILAPLTLAAFGQVPDESSDATPRFPPIPEVPQVKPFQIMSFTEVEIATDLVRAAQARARWKIDGSGPATERRRFAIAVLDTGLNTEHLDFAGPGRIPAQHNFTPEDGRNPRIVTDRKGHGSNVGGIVVAHGTDVRALAFAFAGGIMVADGTDTGIAPKIHTGIAPGANIIPLKIEDPTGVDPVAVVAALRWVIQFRTEYNITVVVVAFGDNNNWEDDSEQRLSRVRRDFLYSEIQGLIKQLRDLRVPAVVAAGNYYCVYNKIGDGRSVKEGMIFPAIFHHTVSVGAVYDKADGPKSYDNGNFPGYGEPLARNTGPDWFTPFSQRLHGGESRTDVFAPGGKTRSSGKDGPDGESVEQGTSQAAPVVAGAILLLQDIHKRKYGVMPCVDHLESWLRDGGKWNIDGENERDNVKHTGKRFPRVDVVEAIEKIQQQPCRDPG